MNRRVYIVLALVLLLAGQAQAALLDTTTGTADTITLVPFAGQSNIGMRSTWAEPIEVPGVLHQYDTAGPTVERFVTTEWQTLATVGPDNRFAADLSFGGEVGPGHAVLKFSRGGTDLTQWRRMSLYDKLIDFTLTAIAQLEDLGHTVELGGFVWIQGGADAKNLTLARDYQKNLTFLVANIRDDLDATDLPVLITLLHADAMQEFSDRVRLEQELFVAADPNAYAVNVDDLLFEPDGEHFTADAQMEMGRRFADAFAQIRAPEPASIVLLVVGMLLVVFVRQTRPE